VKTLYLIATMAGEEVAIAAEAVDSVVKVRDYVPVPSADPFIAGLFALRSRVLTLIDCQYFVTGEPLDVEPGQEAIVVRIEGYSYGLLVDAVRDVTQVLQPPRPLSGRLPAGWNRIGTGMLEIGGETYLLVDAERMVNPGQRRSAA